MLVPDDLGNQVQFYVNCDKNGAMVKKEIWSKALQVQINSLVQKNVGVNKAAGSLYVDRKWLATIHVQGEFQARGDWNLSLLPVLGLEAPKLDQMLKAIVENGGGSSP